MKKQIEEKVEHPMLPHWLRRDFEDKWENLKEWIRLLGVREWVNEHPGAVMSLAAVSGVLFLIVLVAHLVPDKAPEPKVFEKEWFYDLNTGELFETQVGQMPPIDAPSGPMPDGRGAGVRAYVLSYAEEPNEAERLIAFLETTSAGESNILRRTRPASVNEMAQWGRGKLIRRLGDKVWIPADSREGQQIFAEAFAADADGRRPTYCRPK